MNKIQTATAQVISIIFHPLLIPTLGFLLLFNSDFYFAFLPWSLKRVMLLVVFGTTCVLPLISIMLLSLGPNFDLKMEKNTDRVMPLVISSVSYYIGCLILQRLPVFSIYYFFLIASILVQIVLVLISIKWKISAHSAAIGGLVGGIFGLSFRLQENPIFILVSLVLVAGMVGTSRLILGKHTNSQVYAGFLIGFLILNSVILFV